MDQDALLQFLDGLAPLAVLAILGVCLVAVLRVLVTARTRRQFVERGVTDDRLLRMLRREAHLHVLGGLRWGLVFVAIGGATLGASALGLAVTHPAFFGTLALGAGLGLLAYVLLARAMLRDDEEDDVLNV